MVADMVAIGSRYGSRYGSKYGSKWLFLISLRCNDLVADMVATYGSNIWKQLVAIYGSKNFCHLENHTFQTSNQTSK